MRFRAAGVGNKHFGFTQTSFVLPLPRRLGLLIPGNFKTAEVFKGGFETASAVRGQRYVQQTVTITMRLRKRQV